ncbi:MAG: phosphoribosylformylglycinamidine cyclo-ligase [Gammaproteobacteria bacterium]|nr:phosphoribosylformylglycinamidine cyclo-ligase [Gammaproteobacteria bacterium]
MAVNDSKLNKHSLNYRDSGVNITAGDELVKRIKPLVKRTDRPGVIGSLGGFGALFELPIDRFKQPILVSGTDGVGTKLTLAGMMNQHDTIGIDLVAMCVNDIIVSGAEPLYFLDYFASGKLHVDQAEAVIKGITEGCLQAGCALTGGETAELPGMYADGDYDLAGFAVGIVEKDHMLSPENVSVGDTILGLQSSGPHSNGYSLIRKILELNQSDLNQPFPYQASVTGNHTFGQALLEPTRIYVKSILTLLSRISVSALCHITGGGLLENLPRVLPNGVDARISLADWPLTDIFKWLQDKGNVEQNELFRTFNCGIGMTICLPSSQVDQALDILSTAGETVHVLGEVVAKNHLHESPKVQLV